MLKLELSRTLTNEEKIEIYNENKIEANEFNKLLSEWIKKDNLLSYKNLIKKMNIENLPTEKFLSILIDNKINSNEKYILENTKINWYETYKEIIKNYQGKNFNLFKEDSILYFSNIFMCWCNIQLKKQICHYENLIITDSIIEDILRNIGENLFYISSKTLIYEYYNQGEKSFKHYNLNNFKTIDEIERFFIKYPVMVKRLVIKVVYLLNTYIESFERINKDFKEIEKSLNIKLDNTIIDIKGNLGDSHEKGKFVIIYKFKNNSKIVYKPKNLSMAKELYNLIYWINKESSCEKNIIPKNYYGEDYTIEEYIESKSCNNIEQIKRYYKRLGELLAIVYILNGSDFHHENIIASGEFPCLIDLETLFQQKIKLESQNVFTYNNILSDTVEGTCFLPLNNPDSIDVSALNYKNQKLPYKILKLVGDINNPRFEYVDVEITTENNIPILNGQKIDYRNYINCIEKGFKELIEFVINNKLEFIKHLESFKGIKSRQIMRNTSEYANILEYASHPKYTMDMANFEKMLYSMWEHNFADKRFITSEIEDLLYDDIPLFKTITTSRDLIDSKGKRYKNYFQKSAFDYVLEKVNKLDSSLLNKELDYLNICLKNSNHIIDEKKRLKNDLYKVNNVCSKIPCKNKELKDILKNINITLYNFKIKYEDQCIFENLIDYKNSIDIGYKKGFLGIYSYLYASYDKNYIKTKNIEELQNVLFNENIIDFTYQCNGIEGLLDLLSIIDLTLSDKHNRNILKTKSDIISILSQKITNDTLTIYELVKAIKIICNLYKKTLLFKLKKVILLLKNNLERKILELGLNNLKYTRSISISYILYCIKLIKSIYPNIKFNLDINILEQINIDYFKEVFESNYIKNITDKEYRNVIKSLYYDLQNELISYEKIKKLLLNTINENRIDENINYVLDILITYHIKYHNLEVKKLLDNIIIELTKYYTITKNYPFNEMYYFKNLSIENGLSGLGYEILRYLDNNIESIFNIL